MSDASASRTAHSSRLSREASLPQQYPTTIQVRGADWKSGKTQATARHTFPHKLRCRLPFGWNALDARAERAKFGVEVIVAALDVLDAMDGRGSLRAEGRQNVGRTRANIGHCQLGGVQRCRPAHHAAMVVVALAEAAGQLAQAAGEEASVGAHQVEILGVAEAVFVNRLMNYRHPLRL